MSEPKPIQLVLQGGGAKIFALVAALDAIDQAVRDRKIRVSRIAGTSAGAIVGSLYAAGVNPQAIRQALAGFPLEKMARFDGLWGQGRALTRALRSKPLADDRHIANLLYDLFSAARPDSGQVLLEDLLIPTLLVASDVSGRQRIIYDSLGEGKNRSVVSCILDSCAIPFFFRAAGRDSQMLVLDGGLCENLPSELLVSGVPQFGDIVAISFLEEQPATPRTPRELAMALLDTAIGASVRKAKGLGDLFVIELDPFGVGTFDFDKAQKALHGRDALFEHARDKTARMLDEFYSATGRRRVSKSRWDSADPITMRQLYQIYKSQHLSRTFRYFTRQMLIEATSLLQEGEEDYGARDLIVQTLEFAPSREPIDCIAAGIFTDPGERPSDVSCDVFDSDGRPVPFQPVPVRDPENENMYGLLVYFTPPLVSGEGMNKRYFLRTEFRVGEAFPLLKRGGVDFIESQILRADGTVKQVDLVVHIPKSFGRIMVAESASRGVPIQSIQLKDLWGLQRRGHLDVYGWRAADVPNNELVNVRFRRST